MKLGSDYLQVGKYSTTLPFFSSEDNSQTDMSWNTKYKLEPSGGPVSNKHSWFLSSSINCLQIESN